jgi:hypothetical protein
MLAGPGVLLEPEVTLLRLGPGDFRLPYPRSRSTTLTLTLFAQPVTRTVRLAIAGRAAHGRWGAVGQRGVHLIHNGSESTRWVGTIQLSWRTKKEGRVP